MTEKEMIERTSRLWEKLDALPTVLDAQSSRQFWKAIAEEFPQMLPRPNL